jgi:two-component system, OmpR family, phosphate regulon sensor histidine kinase PhoR
MRLAAALVLLALPLAVAVWMLGGVAANRKRSNADERLVAEVNAAGKAYRKLLDARAGDARDLVKMRDVQLALIRGDRRALRRIERAHPSILLRARKQGRAHGPRGASVDVSVGGKTVGRVIAVLPLDRRLVRRLAAEAHGSAAQLGLLVGDRLVLDGGSVPLSTSPAPGSPVDLRADGREYRAVAVPIDPSSRPALVALRPRADIAAAAASVRRRVVAVGLGLVAAVLAIAYAVAPSIASSRLTRQERERAARVLDHLGDGVLVVDRDGVVQVWNPAAESITGLRAAAVGGRRAAEAIPGWQTIASLVPVADRPGSGDSGSSAETVPLEVDGRELWLSVVAVALGGETVYAFRDATHDRRLEDLRSQFVATLSHELRTPLASLHGAALTLRRHGAALPIETRDQLLAMISDQSSRLARLVEEILVAGQLDSGSLAVVVDPFDAEELVRGAVAVAGARAGDEKRIHVSLPPWLPKVHADSERTRQVLLNLLDNAIKYSPEGGRIDLEVAPAGEALRFSVRDQGLGIPVGEQERIFEKFYRLDPDQRRGIGGTGLGLYICRELVRSMGGRIWVESDPAHGTVFSFELPAEQVAAAV